MRCVRSASASTRRVPAGADWTVTPAPLRGPATVDCGLAGTVMRFVPPVAALADGAVAFDGDPRARQRPMAQTVATLRTLGVSIDDGDRGALPFTVHGTGSVTGGAVELDASSSSQFVSALLLAGARYDPRRRRPPRRQAGAVVAAHRHDRLAAARARRRGRRHRARSLGRGTRDRSTRLTAWSSPTCPMPHRSWPLPWSPGVGCAYATGRCAPTRRATGCATCWRRSARR